jgi:nitrogen fixation NifU-like protein
MKDFYKEILLDHYERPRNKGEVPSANIQEHLNNPLCGDEVTVYAKLENGMLSEVAFTARRRRLRSRLSWR